jgi:hypothetical protein
MVGIKAKKKKKNKKATDKYRLNLCIFFCYRTDVLKIDYRLKVVFLIGQLKVIQPGYSVLNTALRRHYYTKVYSGDVSRLTDLRYSFSIMVEGPRPRPTTIAKMEDILCNIWMANSSKSCF